MSDTNFPLANGNLHSSSGPNSPSNISYNMNEMNLMPKIQEKRVENMEEPGRRRMNNQEQKNIDMDEESDFDGIDNYSKTSDSLQNSNEDDAFEESGMGNSSNEKIGQSSRKRKYTASDEEKEGEDESKSEYLNDTSSTVEKNKAIMEEEIKQEEKERHLTAFQYHQQQQKQAIEERHQPKQRRQRQKIVHNQSQNQNQNTLINDLSTMGQPLVDPFFFGLLQNPPSNINGFPNQNGANNSFPGSSIFPTSHNVINNSNNLAYRYQEEFACNPIGPFNVNFKNQFTNKNNKNAPTIDSVKKIEMKNESPQQQLQEARLRTLSPAERERYREEKARSRKVAEKENEVELEENNKIKWFICYESPDCDYKTKYKHCLKRHSKELHAAVVTWFQCDEPGCDYKTKQKSNVQRHKSNIHHVNAGTVYYKCDFDQKCTFTTKYKSDLPRHKREVHEAIYRFECGVTPDCTFQTKLKKGLKSHSLHCHNGAEEDPSIKWYYCQEEVPLSFSENSTNTNTNRRQGKNSAGIAEKCAFKTKFPDFLKQHLQEYHQKLDGSSFKGEVTGTTYVGKIDKSSDMINISESKDRTMTLSDSSNLTHHVMSHRGNSLGTSLTYSSSQNSNMNMGKLNFDTDIDTINTKTNGVNKTYSPPHLSNTFQKENDHSGNDINRTNKAIASPQIYSPVSNNVGQNKLAPYPTTPSGPFNTNYTIDRTGPPVSPVNINGRGKDTSPPMQFTPNFGIDNSTSQYNGLNTSQLGNSVSRSGINIMQKSNLSNDLSNSISGSNGSNNSNLRLNFVGGNSIGVSTSNYSMTNSQSASPFMAGSPTRPFSPGGISSSSNTPQWNLYPSTSPLATSPRGSNFEPSYNGPTNFAPKLQLNQSASITNPSSMMNIPNKNQSKSKKSNVADNTAVLPENDVKGNKRNMSKAQNIAFPPNVGIPNNIALQSTPSPSVSHNYLNQTREHSPYSQYLSPRSFSTQEKFVRDSMATGVGPNGMNHHANSNALGGNAFSPVSSHGTGFKKQHNVNMNINPTIADKILALSKLNVNQPFGNDHFTKDNYSKNNGDGLDNGKVTYISGNEVTSLVTKMPNKDTENARSKEKETVSKSGGTVWYHCDVSPQCAYKTVRKGDLKNHKKRVHLIGENIQIYRCDVNPELCQFTTPYKQALTTHKANIHNIGTNIRWYMCAEEQSIAPRCPYKSKRKGDLQKHQKLIHGIEPPEKKRGRSTNN